MREPLKDAGRLEHILIAIDNACSFTSGHSEEDLTNDKLLFYAVVKCVEIVGEAAYMLTTQFKENHPSTPWKTITGLRHALVHGYYQIESPELWNIIQNDLPPLKEQVEGYLKEVGASQS